MKSTALNVLHSHFFARFIHRSMCGPQHDSMAMPIRKRVAFGFVLLVLLPISSLDAQPPRSSQGVEIPGRIVDVKFQGNHQLSSDELSTVVSTKATGWISNTIYTATLNIAGSPYQTVDNSKLNRDTAALAAHYRDEGFLDARASVRVSQDTSGLHAYYEYLRKLRLMQNAGPLTPPLIKDTVTFQIHEGYPYTISRIAIEGLVSLPNEFQPELTSRVTIKRGERWSRAAAAKEVDRLIGILVENGYPNATEDSIVVQHTQGYHTVNVLIYFQPGHRYRYGPIHILYDTTSKAKGRVADNVILAQMHIDSGHWYKLSEIQRSEANLSKLGTFDLFRIAFDTNYINRIPDSLRDSSLVPIEAYLRMKQASSLLINFVGGQGSQGPIVGAGAGGVISNFTGVADKFDAEFTTQLLPLTQVRYSGSIDYTLPYIGLGTIPLIAGLGYSYQSQSVSPEYNILSLTAHVGSNLILSRTDNKTTLTPGLLVAKVTNTINFPDASSLAAQLVSPDSAIQFQRAIDSIHSVDSNIRAALPPHQINLLPSITWQDDRTNDPINPTSGDLLSTSLEVGVPCSWLFPGDTSSNYVKLASQVKEYFDLSNNGSAVLATRLQAGYSWFMPHDNPGNYPALSHRFFSGGGASVRGWGEQQLLVSDSSSSIAYLGGYSSLIFNLELRFAPFQYPAEYTTWQSFTSPIRIVLFYDAGNTWDQMLELNFRQVSLNQIAQSVGVGLRYNTFFGALRIDWGFKLYDPSGNFNEGYLASTPQSHGKWLFSSGPKRLADISSIHFGIGQAF